jgi:mRNA-degrading endonuclease toxin of MazEF toxin-antitoxin module
LGNIERSKMGKRQRIALQQQANADAVRTERDEARAELEAVRQQLQQVGDALADAVRALDSYASSSQVAPLERSERAQAALRAWTELRGQ